MGCGYAAGIGIRKTVLDEIKEQIIDAHKDKHNLMTRDETTSATEQRKTN